MIFPRRELGFRGTILCSCCSFVFFFSDSQNFSGVPRRFCFFLVLGLSPAFFQPSRFPVQGAVAVHLLHRQVLRQPRAPQALALPEPQGAAPRHGAREVPEVLGRSERDIQRRDAGEKTREGDWRRCSSSLCFFGGGGRYGVFFFGGANLESQWRIWKMFFWGGNLENQSKVC